MKFIWGQKPIIEDEDIIEVDTRDDILEEGKDYRNKIKTVIE